VAALPVGCDILGVRSAKAYRLDHLLGASIDDGRAALAVGAIDVMHIRVQGDEPCPNANAHEAPFCRQSQQLDPRAVGLHSGPIVGDKDVIRHLVRNKQP